MIECLVDSYEAFLVAYVHVHTSKPHPEIQQDTQMQVTPQNKTYTHLLNKLMHFEKLNWESSV
jgi:hypothetical protein